MKLARCLSSFWPASPVILISGIDFVAELLPGSLSKFRRFAAEFRPGDSGYVWFELVLKL